jgi:DNA-binding beta-propeller fold protein YncE
VGDSISSRLVLLLGLVLFHSGATTAVGQVTEVRFYPKANVNDLVVYDHTLYVTSQADSSSRAQVSRFDTSSGDPIPPLQSRGFLYGISLSSDGKFLYAANRGAQEVTRFDLLTGTPSYITFTAPQGVTALDVAVGSSGVGFITTNFAGSGFSQTQRFSPGSTTASAIGGTSAPGVLYNQATLFTDPAGKFVYFVESGISNGSISVYDVAADRYASAADPFGSLDGRAAVSGDGSRLVVGGGYLSAFDNHLNVTRTRTIPPYGGSVAMNPVTSDVYVVTGPDQVTVFDPVTLADTSHFNIPDDLPTYSPFPFQAGRMAFSPDGTSLFVVTRTGVREFSVPIPEPDGATFGAICGVVLLLRRRKDAL